VLPVARRVRRAEEFRSAVRGVRAGGPLLVVHLAVAQPSVAGGSAAASAAPPGPARAGFVVNRAVGGSVVRNRVRRRLRHLVAARLDDVPAGSLLVVRALPGAARATSAELRAALEDGIDRAVRRSGSVEREQVRT
jgi:ribonuclease P protein component